MTLGSFMFSVAEFALVGGIAYFLYRNRRLRIERDELLQEKDVIFGFVHDVGEVFADADSVDLDLLLKRVLFYALRTTRAASGCMYLFEPDKEHLRARAVSGIFPPLVGEVDSGLQRATSKSQHVQDLVKSRLVMRGEGLVGSVADIGAPVLIADAEPDGRVPHYDVDFLKIHSVLLVPMRFHHTVLGALAVVNRVDGSPFVQSDLNILQSLADQASVSIHYAGLRETLQEKSRIDHDLGVARRIQTALLPKELPHLDGLEVAAFNYPAQEIGGDYFDFVQVDASHLGIAIADVSGKGIAGAIMMSVCRSVLRAQAQGNLSPVNVLSSLNHAVAQDMTDDMFVSMLYMILNTSTRELKIARAGHERPILTSHEPSGMTIIDSPGIAIGISNADLFDRALKEVTVPLKAGDVVVAYTDGVTEAMNPEGEEWGVENFMGAVRVAAGEGANSVLNNVRQRLARFVGTRAQYDDMTLLALRIMN
jgi:phosphoserine phosphatase RsbU/P